MKCYRHNDRDAVGSCKACHKGLCPDCATDLGHGLACKGMHEELVGTYHMIIERNAKIYAAAPRNSWIAPVFYAFMGFIFAGFGYTQQGVSSLAFILGVGFVAFAAILFIRSRQMFGSACE